MSSRDAKTLAKLRQLDRISYSTAEGWIVVEEKNMRRACLVILAVVTPIFWAIGWLIGELVRYLQN